MKKFKILTILTLSLIFVSCSSDSEDDSNMNPPDNNDITYSDNIKLIIDGKCLSCHTNPPINNAPMPLTTYQNVRDAVTTRGLIGRVDDGSMPPVGSDLTDSQVQEIRDWQSGGFKE